MNSKDPSWLNTLLLIATFLTLSLVVYSGYKGWKEDRALHYSGPEGHSGIIADIPVNLSGISHREHCLTCHPQGKSVRVSGGDLTFRKDHPSISPHSIDDLGCTGCHLGEGMARDLVISHGRLGNEAQKVLAAEELQGTCYRCHELKSLSGAEKAWDGFRSSAQFTVKGEAREQGWIYAFAEPHQIFIFSLVTGESGAADGGPGTSPVLL